MQHSRLPDRRRNNYPYNTLYLRLCVAYYIDFCSWKYQFEWVFVWCFCRRCCCCCFFGYFECNAFGKCLRWCCVCVVCVTEGFFVVGIRMWWSNQRFSFFFSQNEKWSKKSEKNSQTIPGWKCSITLPSIAISSKI